MRTRMNKDIVVLGFASLCTFSANAAAWSTKTVSGLQPFYVSSNCYYFSLEGVSEADPAVPGSPWFAVDRTAHLGAKDLYAAILAARLSGSPVTVYTTGGTACGYAAVSYIVL
jgi:hypothetical protein